MGSRWLLAHAYVDQDLCGGGEGGRAGRETGAHMAPVHLWLRVAPWVPPVVLSYYLSYYRTIGLKQQVIVLSCYRTIVLSYYRVIVLSCYRTIVLSYYRVIVLSCYRTIVLSCYRVIVQAPNDLVHTLSCIASAAAALPTRGRGSSGGAAAGVVIETEEGGGAGSSTSSTATATVPASPPAVSMWIALIHTVTGALGCAPCIVPPPITK